MSLSLGEKLRQAREERGISISEVAEQTRISPLYLKSIEKDDYKPLPGGIFNKGFVRSYARYIGFDEEEALADYAQLMAEDTAAVESDHAFHRPQVMTDDAMSQSSVAPTLLVVAVILAVLIGGVYLLAKYLSGPSGPAANSNTLAKANNNSNQAAANSETATPATPSGFSVELKALQEPVWVRYTTEEGAKERTLSPNETLSVDVKDSFQLSYARVKASNLQLSINGKRINVPTTGAKGNIEIEVNKSNVGQILQSGAISSEAPAAETPAPTPRPSPTPRPTPKPTTSPAPRPSLPPINAATPKRPTQ